MDKNISNVKSEILYWSKRLYQNGMSPSTSGNISARSGKNFLLSASGVCLNDMDESDIILVDKYGIVLDKNKKNPTSEKATHLKIYETRNDINAIIHCHCPILTAFAAAGIELKEPILPDFALLFEKIELVPFYCPSTDELANAAREVFKRNNAALLKNHGFILGANTLKNAYYQLEILQAYAKTYIYSKVIGQPYKISKSSIKEIKKIYSKKST